MWWNFSIEFPRFLLSTTFFHPRSPASQGLLPIIKMIFPLHLRLWHPNISEEGEICLSLLRPHSVDGLGWAPTRYFLGRVSKFESIFSRRLRDVLWGLSSLFSDLLNFEDPLNIEAADHFRSDQEGFRTKVRDWVVKYAKR